ncbi:PHP domain-containing protein [Algibacillus agarilyticus]|uniref:PHP domain-containing protein n=1 Tax=Algibacillus agarilyticus TaxID=2234133 RepID=UPI000DD07397|nr:PHP domain-containing protein [Algibacillus agarilyticus]
MKIDLHSHTTCSDGSLTPAELVLRASTFEVDVLAITDHDSIQALDLAYEAKAKYKLKLQIINGVEISTSWEGQEIHIVGLNVDRNCSLFKSRLDQQLQTRVNRAERYAHKLENCGIKGALAGANHYARGKSISRVHFAKFLVNEGHVSSFDQAFKKYLAKNAKAYVSPGWIDIPEAIKWIKEAGGQAVLAHPTRYDLTNKWVRKLVAYFAQEGGEAIEVSLPRQSPNEKQQLAQYAIDANLKASAGSDFHHIGRFGELGRDINLPDIVTPIWHDWSITKDH